MSRLVSIKGAVCVLEKLESVLNIYTERLKRDLIRNKKDHEKYGVVDIDVSITVDKLKVNVIINTTGGSLLCNLSDKTMVLEKSSGLGTDNIDDYNYLHYLKESFIFLPMLELTLDSLLEADNDRYLCRRYNDGPVEFNVVEPSENNTILKSDKLNRF